MALYLNTNKQFENYKELTQDKFFVDKSEIITLINEKVATENKYICITRPRRFGKSSVADMLGAYYSKAIQSACLFDKLNISSSADYLVHLNQNNVISISFTDVNHHCKSCADYVERMTRLIIEDLKEAFPHMKVKKDDALWDLLSELNEKFIFIFDEWDYIFNSHLFVQEQDLLLEFLMKLLKDKPYVDLAYMTGILPIAKYSNGSALNMFDEYTMLNDKLYGEYFGFTQEEVIELCKKQSKVSFYDMSQWYNGYFNKQGEKIYNSYSVVKALQNGKCRSYWTNTGAMDEVVAYLKYNIMEVREDVIAMVAGEVIHLSIKEEFRAGQQVPKSKKEIYSAMISLGLLSYHDSYLKIPNQELMLEFEKALEHESFGYVAKIIQHSRKMLKATISGDCETVVNRLYDIHNSGIPILQYHDETSLACAMTLAYLSARDTYRIEREEKTGKGYVDFTFYPRRKTDSALIIEFKKDDRVEVALEQIKQKEYAQKFKKEYKAILVVVICYDSKKKEHHCKSEYI